MKKVKYFAYLLVFILFAQTAAAASIGDGDDALDMFKTYINTTVQKAKKAENPSAKREILDNSFDKIMTTFDRVQQVKALSEKDNKALNLLRDDIQQKKAELNGEEGFERVRDKDLNDFANYVQQDFEQALSISISATVLVLIIIILLLL